MLEEGMMAPSQSIHIKGKHTFLFNATLSFRALFLGQANDDWTHYIDPSGLSVVTFR